MGWLSFRRGGRQRAASGREAEHFAVESAAGMPSRAPAACRPLRAVRPHGRQILSGGIIWLLAALAPQPCPAAEPLPRSVLILDQSDADSAWYASFSTVFRSTLRAEAPAR